MAAQLCCTICGYFSLPIVNSRSLSSFASGSVTASGMMMTSFPGENEVTSGKVCRTSPQLQQMSSVKVRRTHLCCLVNGLPSHCRHAVLLKITLGMNFSYLSPWRLGVCRLVSAVKFSRPSVVSILILQLLRTAGMQRTPWHWHGSVREVVLLVSFIRAGRGRKNSSYVRSIAEHRQQLCPYCDGL